MLNFRAVGSLVTQEKVIGQTSESSFGLFRLVYIHILYVSPQTHTHIHAYTRTYTCTHTPIHTQAHTHMCTHTHHTHTYTNTHTYIHTCTYTLIHTTSCLLAHVYNYCKILVFLNVSKKGLVAGRENNTLCFIYYTCHA